MICVLCATIILAVCHLSYSSQSNFYVNPKHAPLNSQSNTKRAEYGKKQSNIVDSYEGAPRRNRHYPSDEPKKEKTWRFDLDVPNVLDTLKKYVGVTVTNANGPGKLRAEEDGLLGQKLRFEVKPPNIGAIMSYLGDLINLQSTRRFNRIYHGYVEEGPGTIKSLSFENPPGYQEGRLKILMRIKKKRAG